MKIKIEIDLTPEEAQELFIPGEKQAEFAEAMALAYINAMQKVATGAIDSGLKKLFRVDE
jgi:hypothetical protein